MDCFFRLGILRLIGMNIQRTLLFQPQIQVVQLEKLRPHGNKYYKLHPNLQAAHEQGFDRIVSFGGAWSNHILALAEMAAAQSLQGVGVIRGEQPASLSATLSEARALGMHLHFVARSEYHHRRDPAFVSKIEKLYGHCNIIPEGGSNILAVQGCQEIVKDIEKVCPDYDVIVLPVGTGGTIAGIASALPAGKRVIGISVLKGAGYLDTEIRQLLASAAAKIDVCAAALDGSNWSVDHRFHEGGYAKVSAALKSFILEVEHRSALRLDPVYTGKMLLAVTRLIDSGEIRASEKVLALHTGGSQGRRGFTWLPA